MKNSILLTVFGLLICQLTLSAQEQKADSELLSITETLMHYIEGTANSEKERINLAFDDELNLYSVSKTDSLKTWYGKDYIAGFTEGKKNNRVGRIISIDYENNAAMAKVEIKVPGWRTFIDYMLLLKYGGQWKIVHKSYTWYEVEK